MTQTVLVVDDEPKALVLVRGALAHKARHRNAALVVVTLLTLLSASPAAHAGPDQYSAFYTVVEKDARSKEYRQNMLRFYEKYPRRYMDPNTTPQAFALTAAARTKSLKTTDPDQVYDAQVALRNGDILYRLQARPDVATGAGDAEMVGPIIRPGSEYVLVYNKNQDATTSVERLPKSVGDVWIDKGLDSRKVPFLLLAGEDSPFLAPGVRANALKLPLQAGPRYGKAGARAEVLYQPARREQQGSRVLLTASDKCGKLEEWVFEYDDAVSVGKTLPRTIRHTTFRGVPTPASGYSKSVMMAHAVWIARLNRVNNRAVEAELFEPDRWLKGGDQITDCSPPGSPI